MIGPTVIKVIVFLPTCYATCVLIESLIPPKVTAAYLDFISHFYVSTYIKKGLGATFKTVGRISENTKLHVKKHIKKNT